MNEFNEYVRECLSVVGDIAIRPMMGGYLMYLNGKLIGDIGDKKLFLKRTPASDMLQRTLNCVTRMMAQGR